jgi:uncharacterized protein (DUF362 family)
MNTDIFFSKVASYVHNQFVKHYCLKVPFDPPEPYPELSFIRNTNKDNMVYPMVRELLQKLGMDKENIGTTQWNPLKDIVSVRNKVLIKPNLVTHRHYLGEKALYGAVVHGSLIRPIIDYVYLALKGEGSITIADNPLESADFESIMKFTGIQEMVNELNRAGYDELKVIDLRPKVTREDKHGKFYYEPQTGDPLGYATVDLEENSLFSEFDHDAGIHYYTLSDPTIDHLDPKCKSESATDTYHNPLSHRYIVSKSVLDSDVIINIAKMKTHCKAGVTLALKNIIGMVYQKDCMPHHRPGLPPRGDSFPHYPAPHYIALRKLYRALREQLQIHRFPGFRSFRNVLQKKEILVGQHVEHGNWKGNDTIWRTILDLNRIVMYANKKGEMCDTPQRKYIAFIDGIIAQEGEGPVCGNPIIASIIFGGFNPVAVDALAIQAMGIDITLIKSISQTGRIKKWKLLQGNGVFPTDIKVPTLNFKLPKGWS